MALPARLMTVGSMVIPGTVVADIGTNLASLPIYLVRERICPRVVAVENNPVAFREAARRIRQGGMVDNIVLRLADGLAGVQPAEAHTVVMAGIGGLTIREILCRSMPVTATVERLILQPMRQVVPLLKWLNSHGWSLQQGDLVLERRRFYEILVAVPGRGVPENQLDVGGISTILVTRQHPLLPLYLAQKLRQYKTELAGATRGSHRGALARKRTIAIKIAELQEAMQWLP